MEKCPHYNRGCKFVAPCCGNVVNCRICHDEKYDDHPIDRFKVTRIQCNQCALQQDVSNRCVNHECGLQFAEYFCEVCRLYDTHETNNYYHCDKCGICRVGWLTDVFHCDECNMCFSLKLRDNHKCRREMFNADCCICLNDLFTSREASTALPCGHAIHVGCRNEWMKKNIGCPICRKTMLCDESLKMYNECMDALVREIDTGEAMTTLINVKCNDCGKSNKLRYHPLAIKCVDCGSYNTTHSS